MKIHELCSGLHKLGITVPTDMWNIEETYFSNSKSEYVNVRDMDIFHVVRAFCKQIRNDDEIDIKQSLSTLKNQICDLQDKIQEQSYEN
tara:strand:+ start:30 stop:296 length:267 start_codon:yes stop_codon:yes gene_type:complete